MHSWGWSGRPLIIHRSPLLREARQFKRLRIIERAGFSWMNNRDAFRLRRLWTRVSGDHCCRPCGTNGAQFQCSRTFPRWPEDVISWALIRVASTSPHGDLMTSRLKDSRSGHSQSLKTTVTRRLLFHGGHLIYLPPRSPHRDGCASARDTAFPNVRTRSIDWPAAPPPPPSSFFRGASPRL